MPKIKVKAEHYTETLIYSIDCILKNIKNDLNKYITSLNLGITAEQFSVLDTIGRNNTICQQDIADILFKDKSNVKRIVEILEKKEFIKRQVGRKNNRLANFLSLTENGKILLNSSLPKIKNFIENDLVKDISNDEIEILRNIAAKFK